METNEIKSRAPVIDVLKAIASQLIVWHHLTVYGPMPETVYPYAGGVFDWMQGRARIAVQIFFVIGGFLAAQSLHQRFEAGTVRLWRLFWGRYLRLARPYLFAVVAAILAGLFARAWLFHPATPTEPSLRQVIAHIFLLQDIVGEEALSAGVWYVAVDFQLFAMLAILLWTASKISAAGRVAMSMVAVPLCGSLVILSLFWWNRNAGLDIWATYFFGSYGLGVLAQRISVRERRWRWTLLLAGLVAAALAVEWRDRILVAGATAVVLACGSGYAPRWSTSRVVAFLSRISYPLFVIHSPVCLAVNTVVFHFWPGIPLASGLGMLAAWLLSIAAGTLLYRIAEAGPRRRDRSIDRTPTRGSREPVPPTHPRPLPETVSGF